MGSRPRGSRAVALAAMAVVAATEARAVEADLSTVMSGQPVVHQGDIVTYLVTYANGGPDAATSAYANLFIPSGVPAPLTELTQDDLDALETSAQGTDTLGNTPMLFLESNYCESLQFQVQGPAPPDPVQGLEPGVAGAFSLGLPIPMQAPRLARLVISEPPALAREYAPGFSSSQLYANGPETRRYGMGGNCGQFAFGCSVLEDCFGPRLGHIDPISAQLELVNDGGIAGDPTFGCGKPIGFTAGRIAVIRRGECQFVEKARFAQEVRAAGVLIVNDGRCAGLGPDSDDCVINMDGTDVAGRVDIPIVLLSVNDGEPIIAELEGGGAVRALMGAMSREAFELTSTAFHVDPVDTDPDPGNNDNSLGVAVGIFADGLESGDLSEWSVTRPTGGRGLRPRDPPRTR